MTNFTLFVTFAVINGVVLVLRIHDPDAPRPFRVPGSIGRIPILPILGIATCGLLILQLEATIIALGCILTAIGAVVATGGIPRGAREKAPKRPWGSFGSVLLPRRIHVRILTACRMTIDMLRACSNRQLHCNRPSVAENSLHEGEKVYFP